VQYLQGVAAWQSLRSRRGMPSPLGADRLGFRRGEYHS